MYRFIFLMVGPTLIGCGGTGEGAADEGGRGSNDGASTMSPGDTSAPVQDGATAQADAGQFALTSLDEPCEGGPTGRQLVAYVESKYAGTYNPPPTRPAASLSALTITAYYDGGAIECIPAPPFNCCAGCPCRTPPPPSVSVDLDVGFKTADGTLNESFVGTATFEPDVYETLWTATIPRDMVNGTYSFSAGSTALAFSGTFRNAQANGSIVEDPAPALGGSTLSGGTWTASATDGGTD